jgi:hypothetical protein
VNTRGHLVDVEHEQCSSQLTRNYNFLGEEAMAKVRDGYVVVVGCGGVGSWCALMLLRRYASARLGPEPVLMTAASASSYSST